MQAAAGKGAISGLPTASNTGVITMTYHQVLTPLLIERLFLAITISY